MEELTMEKFKEYLAKGCGINYEENGGWGQWLHPNYTYEKCVEEIKYYLENGGDVLYEYDEEDNILSVILI